MKSKVLARYITGALLLIKVFLRIIDGSLFTSSDFVIVPLFGFIFWCNITPVCDVITRKGYITGWFAKDDKYLIYKNEKPLKYVIWLVIKIFISLVAVVMVLTNFK